MKTKKIPKVIHYCWFGANPLPELAIKCIESWKKYLPDYKIKRWDETNFNVNINEYTQQAYEAKKYAFVSDYARFWILYNYGGLYFDTDVEVIKSMDEIIAKGPFMGCENPYNKGESPRTLGVNPGLGIGVYAGHHFYKELIDLYDTLQFRRSDRSLNKTTIVTYTSNLLSKHGLLMKSCIQQVVDIHIYPVDYFCPLNYKSGELRITENTVTIYHYSASWKNRFDKYKELISKIIGPHLTNLLISIRRIIGNI